MQQSRRHAGAVLAGAAICLAAACQTAPAIPIEAIVQRLTCDEIAAEYQIAAAQHPYLMLEAGMQQAPVRMETNIAIAIAQSGGTAFAGNFPESSRSAFGHFESGLAAGRQVAAMTAVSDNRRFMSLLMREYSYRPCS